MPRENRIIRVTVVSDITCPWCYIATVEIDRAIEQLQLPPDSPVKFELEHKPYLLNPSWREDESRKKSEYLVEKLGKERWTKVFQMLRDRGKEVGIKLYVSYPAGIHNCISCVILSEDNGIVCSTWRAHRLLSLAWNKGGSEAQSKLLKALYKASFERGENVADIDILSKYAEQCGTISKDEVCSPRAPQPHNQTYWSF